MTLLNMLMRGILINKYISYLVISIIVFIGTSCGSKTVECEHYLKALNEEKDLLIINQEVDGIQYKLRCFLPEEQLLKSVTCKSYNENPSLLSEFNERVSFSLIIKDLKENNKVKKLVESKNDYGALLRYANTELTSKIFLSTDLSETEAGIIHLEPSNSMDPVLRFSILFSNISNIKDGFTFIFNDEIFNNGPIRFSYKKEILNKLPSLKLNTT